MFGRIIWFGTGAVSGALGALWTERKVRKALRRQRRAAAERVIAPPDSTRAAIWQSGRRAQGQVKKLYAQYRPDRRHQPSDVSGSTPRQRADGEVGSHP